MNKSLFTLNSHLKNRYLLQNTTLLNRFQKISKLVSRNEILQDYYQLKFYEIMKNGSFLPAGNTLVATEKPIHPNCAIYGDICESTFDKDKHRLSSIWSHSTGLGFQFDNCKNPVNVLKKLSKLHSDIDLKHRPQRGNFGTLTWDHPYIKEFITCKQDHPDSIYNFNISITFDTNFWECYQKKDGLATKVMDLITESIYVCGDPGILFIDKIKMNHPEINTKIYPPRSELNTLVPCGEQAMYTNETCNLGSINLNSPFFRSNLDIIHFDRLRDVIHYSVRFLDNVVDILDIPDKEMEERTLQLRRIGLGVSGFDDYLKKKRITYGSEKSFYYAEIIAGFFASEARLASTSLAYEKGSNDLLSGKRNETVTCLPPTGGISLLWNNKGFSIEPSFEDALEISPEKHIKMVSIWQKYIDNSISKTVNLPEDYKKEDLPKLIHYAYLNDIKNITFYRDQSRAQQPLSLCNTC